jgi:hypothetical protein
LLQGLPSIVTASEMNWHMQLIMLWKFDDGGSLPHVVACQVLIASSESALPDADTPFCIATSLLTRTLRPGDKS